LAKFNIGQTLRKAKQHVNRGEFEQARQLYTSALQAFPNNKRAQEGLSALNADAKTPAQNDSHPPQAVITQLVQDYQSGRFETVAEQLPILLERYPNSEFLWNIEGAVKSAFGATQTALEAFTRVIQLNPDSPEGHNNLGNALFELRQYTAALESYMRVLRLAPNFAEAHNNLGSALHALGQPEKAVRSYQRALELKPDYPDAHYGLGNALKEQGLLADAVKCCKRALKLKPNYPVAQALLFHQQQQICEWQDLSESTRWCATLGIEGKSILPFGMLSAEDNAHRHMLRSINFAQEEYKHLQSTLASKPAQRPQKLRIGYFSADFHDHATLYLMAGLLREHDKSKFELYAYSYGKIQNGKWRKRLIGDVDVFREVRDLTDQETVDLAHADKLDIAIDLKGYTGNTRSQLFAHRLASVQINFLGYPGTMGADFMDYIIADETVIPSDQRQAYTERVIYLPHTYQPNDNTRPIASTDTKRSDFGLPEEAFVFCCFNNNYKISPSEYDIWMRILRRLKGSVLWLLRSNSWAETNLRHEAKIRGVAPERIVFADRLPQDRHLARHKHADLFIDTFNYNAHTTASDALWAGLPLVTRAGEQFAARVAASLLNAVGLPELVTTNAEAYERLILDLATNPSRLIEINRKLEQNKRSQPLFDTQTYTKNFEAGVEMAYQQYFDGPEPTDIHLSQKV